MAIWSGHRGRLHPDLRAAIEQRFTGFRYWFTDPLPADVVDDKWFWSENHRLIVHTLEYLAGRQLPDPHVRVHRPARVRPRPAGP